MDLPLHRSVGIDPNREAVGGGVSITLAPANLTLFIAGPCSASSTWQAARPCPALAPC